MTTVMFLAEAGRLFTGFILFISGVQGANRICALKSSSVDLPCSPDYPTSSINWYTLHLNGSQFVRKNFSGDGSRITYNTSGEGNFSLTMNDLREGDANLYCCGTMIDNARHCWFYRTELRVTDLQVKVIPTAEGQTVTLMCSTSCPLTEKPPAYIWYKNREFLYQDWSPWYQELVPSEEAVTFSCAIKGYQDLRAPEVSVGSVTSTCFNVTYAKGRMCSYKQEAVDEPCSITYPTEVHAQRTTSPLGDIYSRLTCAPSCPLTDLRPAYKWYWRKKLYRHSESQHLTVPRGSEVSCAVKGHEDLHSAEVCEYEWALTGVTTEGAGTRNCQRLNYVSRRICALKGSSVKISSTVAGWASEHKWYKIERRGEGPVELSATARRRVYQDKTNSSNLLTIKRLKKNDSAEYVLRGPWRNGKFAWRNLNSPGVTLVVTGLKVTLTPSAVVTEGQRVTLSCSTSCPLTDNTNYIWYLNSRPLTLTENQNKHLVLDPVSTQHAGNYSCTVKTHQSIKSPKVTLSVQVHTMTIINAARLTVALLIPVPLLLFHLWMRHLHKTAVT